MEDEKKKKRNKKKKNKQNKASEDDASTDHTSNAGNAHQNGALPNADVNADSNAHRDNGLDESVSAEAEKQQFLQREADLKQEISRLLEENESHIQKEADLEVKINGLQEQNDLHVQKQASLEDTIKGLISANDICSVKEAEYEEKINQFKIEKNAFKQKEADLEMKIAQLQHEKGLWLEKENASRETIGKQNVDIARLRMQVVELEENKSSLLKENEVLAERISDLQSRVQSLETSISIANTTERTKIPLDLDKVNPQVEAAHALVNKLMTENAELVEKVNELYVKLNQKGQELYQSSYSESDDGTVGNAEIVGTSASPAESVHYIPGLSSKLEATEAVPAVAPIPVPSEADSAEIVQISLDDTEIEEEEEEEEEEEKEMPSAELDNGVIPLTDAPLIGAPFRLISFVASYVSGADLVNRS